MHRSTDVCMSNHLGSVINVISVYVLQFRVGCRDFKLLWQLQKARARRMMTLLLFRLPHNRRPELLKIQYHGYKIRKRGVNGSTK